MTLPVDARLPIPALSYDYVRQLTVRLTEIVREHANAANTGDFWTTQGTAAPTTGTWSQGNTCKNTAPSEAGSASSKYVVIGWICTVGGTPGTWLAMRTLTGN